MACSAVLADLAGDELQQRSLARYAFLYGDAALLCLSVWRNRLARETAMARDAKRIKRLITELRHALEDAGDVRDYLAAKRQPVRAMRADDLEATAKLWLAVNPANVSRIGAAAIAAYDALNTVGETRPTVVDVIAVEPSVAAAVQAALPGRDPDYWHLATDSSAELRMYTLPVAGGGEMGRRVAQINDGVVHLDVLLRLAPVLDGAVPYDWLVRSAMLLELNTLLDLAVGGPPSGRRTVAWPLLELCRLSRATDAASDLEKLRDSIGAEGWNYVRWARNVLSAHLDKTLSLFHLHQHLELLDYPGVVGLAEHVLDWLDAIGAAHLDLRLLAFPQRPIRSWPVDPARVAPGRPETPMLPGVLAAAFRRVDGPYMAYTGSAYGSAVVAGATANRQPAPRTKVTVRRWHPVVDRPAPGPVRRRALGSSG